MRSRTVKAPLERTVRLTAGLILFSYATCHFASHATGLLLPDGIQRYGHDVILAPWRTAFGLWLLLAAFLTHLGLGLKALYRRRTLRMPAIEGFQLALGLSIPLLLATHVADARLAVTLFGAEDSYFRVLYLFWLTDPLGNLPRQFALLVVVWTHGCIGIWMALRFRRWIGPWRVWLGAAALLLPSLAILGVVNAGWNTVLRAAVEPGFAQAHGPPPDGPHAFVGAAIGALAGDLQIFYLALLGAVLAARAWRSQAERRGGSIRVDYPGGRRVVAPRGFSILEASRLGRIPHASVCGARARCSTCRVRISSGLERLAPAAAAEASTLRRIRAPDNVRLACQVRPVADVGVAPLIAPGAQRAGLRFGADTGHEAHVTALHVDLRDSTRLAAGRLPFDALFVVGRYVQAATGAILASGGHVTSIAGDGIMSVFGHESDARTGARDALAAAAAAWRAIDAVSAELASEIGAPLQFGMGLHSGPSVVGWTRARGVADLQFLGDTGNVAARLEGLTKEMECVAIVSTATLEAAQWNAPGWRGAMVELRGRDQPLAVFPIARLEDLAAAGASAAPAPA